MKKKSKKVISIVLVCVISIIAILGITIGITNGLAKKINDTSSPISELSSWMSNIKDDTLVKNIVIPGAHDSGTYSMMWAAKTQDREIKDLLSCGVRYFDLRVASKKDKLVVFHGPIKGAEFEPILNDIASFLENNPSELLILDFQKFKDTESEVIALIEEKLNGKLVVNNTMLSEIEFIENLKLSDCRGKAIIYWGVVDGNLSNDYVFSRNNDKGTRSFATMQSYYARSNNTKSSKKYISDALPEYINKYKESNGGLFVLQCQLTDPVLLIGPKYYEYTNEKNMDVYIESLSTSDDLQYINILMRDFINPTKAANIIKLNSSKGLIKSGQEEVFNQIVLNPCA